MLREAAALESRGDLEGAERVLRELLTQSPGSSGGLFALERVLRAGGRTEQILPVIRDFLGHDPASSGVRYLELRVLQEADSLEALERRAEEWLSVEPGEAGTYREVARVYERAFGRDRALGVLRRGRAAAGDPSTLALEIGDLLAAGGQVDAAVGEWTLAAAGAEADASAVARRIQSLPARHHDAAAGRVLSTLGSADDVATRRTGARLALELGRSGPALDISESVAGSLEGAERAGFLSDVARRAHDGGMAEVAAWAYRELGRETNDAVERRALDERLVEASLAAGDTAAALEAQRRLTASYPQGSVDRRRAVARQVRLEAARADPGHLRRLLGDFRDEFPDAPELDELAATLAARLHARGEAEGAAAVLEGIEGPRSAVERAFLLLDAGRIQEGRGALLSALQGLPPEEATDVIQLAGLLGRLGQEGQSLVAAASVAEHRGRASGAVETLADGAEVLPEAERPLVLAEAARIADRAGLREDAAGIRARILDEHPDAPEFEEASLALARHRARTRDGIDSAIRILEELIAARPDAAVVPHARLELERLRGRGRG